MAQGHRGYRNDDYYDEEDDQQQQNYDNQDANMAQLDEVSEANSQ